MFAGSPTFASSTATAPHQVDRASTGLVFLGGAPHPSQVGEIVTVTFSVITPGSGTPTGIVTVGGGGGGGG